MLRLQQIRKSYQVGPVTLEVLKCIDLRIQEGEFISIMGQSGSGKSTLMNIIGLLDTPSSGRYLIDGRDVVTANQRDRARLRNRNVGFVFQSFHLLPRITAAANVALPLVYRGVGARERRRAAQRWLERVGMGDRLHHRPNELSGGQRQRVAIARALVGQPRLLLADEPTGALDEATSAEIMKLFIELNRTERVTTVVITHDPGVAAQCRRQLRLDSGHLSEPRSSKRAA
ncbi:MAG: ABC transporter ATP-binding protein [Geminicoccaceae bacterium]